MFRASADGATAPDLQKLETPKNYYANNLSNHKCQQNQLHVYIESRCLIERKLTLSSLIFAYRIVRTNCFNLNDLEISLFCILNLV